MNELEKLQLVVGNLLEEVQSSKARRTGNVFRGSRVRSAQNSDGFLNEATRLADRYISMWEELPFEQQKPTKISRPGILKEDYTQEQAKAVLNQLFVEVTPKIKMAVSKHLHDGYTMDDALQDVYERLWKYAIPAWDQTGRVQKDFVKFVGLVAGSWASTQARKYKATAQKETGLTYTSSEGDEVEKDIGHATIPTSEIEFNEAIERITAGDELMEQLVDYLIENYTKKPSVLRREAIKKFKLQEGEFETALSKLAERIYGRRYVASSKTVKSSRTRRFQF